MSPVILSNEAWLLPEANKEKRKERVGQLNAFLPSSNSNRDGKTHMTGPKKLVQSSQLPTLIFSTCLFISSPHPASHRLFAT